MQTVLMENQFLIRLNFEVHSIFFKRAEPNNTNTTIGFVTFARAETAPEKVPVVRYP
jgi:hypothetical protein